jgi:hypothetical protein
MFQGLLQPWAGINKCHKITYYVKRKTSQFSNDLNAQKHELLESKTFYKSVNFPMDLTIPSILFKG